MLAAIEFLGDAVLGLVVAETLFRSFPNYSEGQKSKIKANLVSTAALAEMAELLGLGDHMILGRGEEKTGGRRKQALLAGVKREVGLGWCEIQNAGSEMGFLSRPNLNSPSGTSTMFPVEVAMTLGNAGG